MLEKTVRTVAGLCCVLTTAVTSGPWLEPQRECQMLNGFCAVPGAHEEPTTFRFRGVGYLAAHSLGELDGKINSKPA